MFSPLFCKITVLSAVFIVTQGFDFRMRHNDELGKIIDVKLLNELFGERSPPHMRTRRFGRSENNIPPLCELADQDPHAEHPHVPVDHTDPPTVIKSNGDDKTKRNRTYLALYPALERILRAKGYAEPQRKAYAVNEDEDVDE